MHLHVLLRALSILCVGNEGPHQTAHVRTLIWVYLARKRINVFFFFFFFFFFSNVELHLLFYITKTYLYNFGPLKHHFYIVKLGFTGVYIIFFISAHKHRLCGLNEYPQSIFWAEIWKISEFLSETFQFCLVVKFSIYLNRRVFVMIYLFYLFFLFYSLLFMQFSMSQLFKWSRYSKWYAWLIIWIIRVYVQKMHQQSQMHKHLRNWQNI